MAADPLLNWLVGLVERQPPGAGLPISLWTPAGVVTGILVSAAHYHALLAVDLEKAFGRVWPEAAVILKEQLDGLAESSYADVKEQEQHSRQAALQQDYFFIHLMDARLTSASGFVPPHPYGGVPWRGRIAEVIGFTAARQFTRLPASTPTP